MLRIPFWQCVGPLAIGLFGFAWLRRKWGRPEVMLGGLLLGGLGMWLAQLTLLLLNWVGNKMLVLAGDVAMRVVGASMIQAAVIGAWLTFAKLVVFEIAALIAFIALFGAGVGQEEWGTPISDENMSVTIPLRGWMLWAMPLVFTWLMGPLFGAALGILLAAGAEIEYTLSILIVWFPVAMAVLFGLSGVALGFCSVQKSRKNEHRSLKG